MTREWVVLILGLAGIIAILLGYVAWTAMRARMFEAVPLSLPLELLPMDKEDDTKS